MPGTNYPGRENMTPETKPQPHPATPGKVGSPNSPERVPGRIATNKPQTERTDGGTDA